MYKGKSSSTAPSLLSHPTQPHQSGPQSPPWNPRKQTQCAPRPPMTAEITKQQNNKIKQQNKTTKQQNNLRPLFPKKLQTVAGPVTNLAKLSPMIVSCSNAATMRVVIFAVSCVSRHRKGNHLCPRRLTSKETKDEKRKRTLNELHNGGKTQGLLGFSCRFGQYMAFWLML